MTPLARAVAPMVLAFGAASASAAPIEFGMTVQGRVGYGSNPFLADDDNPGSLLAGIQLQPRLSTSTPTSTSTLSGFYDYTGYTKRYGHSDAFGINLDHRHQLSERLTANVHAGYVDSFNTLFSPIDLLDEVTFGQRQRSFGSNFGFDYQASLRDSFYIQGNARRAWYPGVASRLSDYSEYGGGGGYRRQISNNTSIGAQLFVRRYESDFYGNSTSFSPSLTLRQRLSAEWSLDGHVGAILFRSRQAGISANSTTIGFGADLCRRNERTTLCFSGGRESSPSGLGGQRTETRGSVNYSHQLTERSSVNLSGSYGRSNSSAGILSPRQTYKMVQGGYDYRLTQRISLGATADYRQQSYRGFRNTDAVAGALTVTARLGRMN